MLFGFFFDIFASIGFVGLVFGLCRGYAGLQRGRAVGNGDFLAEYDPGADRWLAIARLRFVLDTEHGAAPAARRQREYRRRLRRFLYAGTDAVMLEGVVERKSWLHDALSDLMVLVWHGQSREAASAGARQDLARLGRELARYDARLSDDGSVRVAFACAELDDEVAAGSTQAAQLRLHELIGRVLVSSAEAPLARHEELSNQENAHSGET